jgi:hypothetical protein
VRHFWRQIGPVSRCIAQQIPVILSRRREFAECDRATVYRTKESGRKAGSATVRRGSFSASTTVKGTRGNIGQVIGVPGKPLLTAEQSQETPLTFTLHEETIVGAGGRRDTEGTGAQRTGRQHHGGIHGQAIRDIPLFTLIREDRLKLVFDLLPAGLIRPRRHLSDGRTAGRGRRVPTPPTQPRETFDLRRTSGPPQRWG